MAKRTGTSRLDQTAGDSPPRRVALLLNFITRRCRQELHGIHRYVWPVRQWLMRVRAPDLSGLADALEWKPDGIIMEVTDPSEIPPLQDSGIPVVNVSSQLAQQPFARVESDDRAIGRMAAEHFLAKGFRNYGYLDAESFHGSQLRQEGFIQRLREAGRDASVLALGQNEGASHHWAKASDKLVSWLQSLPKPAAILAYDDHYASLLSQACISAGLAVPEQVALLGVENDDLCWSLSYPPLSSIQTASEQVGFDAARILDRLMGGDSGDDAPIVPMHIPPVGVVERASTDILAIDDSDVAMAVRFINANATRRINVSNVVAAVPLGRRVLEKRFRQALKRTILDEIQRVRVERAKHMLATTRDLVPSIAKATGFRNGTHLWQVFRKLTGMSPDTFRRTEGQLLPASQPVSQPVPQPVPPAPFAQQPIPQAAPQLATGSVPPSVPQAAGSGGLASRRPGRRGKTHRRR